MTPEGRVKARIKDYLDKIGAYQFWPVQMGYGKRTLDCLICYKGRFIAVEAKKPGGKETAHQTTTRHEIVKKGGAALTISTEDDFMALQEIVEGIDEAEVDGDIWYRKKGRPLLKTADNSWREDYD